MTVDNRSVSEIRESLRAELVEQYREPRNFEEGEALSRLCRYLALSQCEDDERQRAYYATEADVARELCDRLLGNADDNVQQILRAAGRVPTRDLRKTRRNLERQYKPETPQGRELCLKLAEVLTSMDAATNEKIKARLMRRALDLRAALKAA